MKNSIIDEKPLREALWQGVVPHLFFNKFIRRRNGRFDEHFQCKTGLFWCVGSCICCEEKSLLFLTPWTARAALRLLLSQLHWLLGCFGHCLNGWSLVSCDLMKVMKCNIMYRTAGHHDKNAIFSSSNLNRSFFSPLRKHLHTLHKTKSQIHTTFHRYKISHTWQWRTSN